MHNYHWNSTYQGRRHLHMGVDFKQFAEHADRYEHGCIHRYSDVYIEWKPIMHFSKNSLCVLFDISFVENPEQELKSQINGDDDEDCYYQTEYIGKCGLWHKPCVF